jgi:hypothetical protein
VPYAEPFVARFEFGDGSVRTFLLTREGETLKVQDFDSRGPAREYTFVRGA